MLDELLGKAKEDGLVVQEVVTHFQFSGYWSRRYCQIWRKTRMVTYYQMISNKSLLYRTLIRYRLSKLSWRDHKSGRKAIHLTENGSIKRHVIFDGCQRTRALPDASLVREQNSQG